MLNKKKQNNMTTLEKKNVMLGETYVAPTIIEKKALVNGKEVVTVEDGEETLTLRPVSVKHWSDLEKTRVTELPLKLIYLTCRKSKEWVEETLNPNCFVELYLKCKEINTGFFASMDLQVEMVMENQKKQAEFQAKSGLSSSTASENSSQMQQTD